MRMNSPTGSVFTGLPGRGNFVLTERVLLSFASQQHVQFPVDHLQGDRLKVLTPGQIELAGAGHAERNEQQHKDTHG